MGPVLCDPQSLIKDLNPQQMEAVKYYGQALLIGAGAGSGKTRVLTRRIAWLLAHGFWASSILAITFTNKAAAEMRERLAALVGPEAEHMWISTFHSACVRILRRDGKEIGLTSGFSIYDTADCERLIKLISGDLNIDTKRYTPRMLLGKISDCKNSLTSWQDQLKSVNCDYKPGQRGYQVSAGDVDELVAVVYAEYQHRLAMANAVDFDDLIMRTVELFQRCPQVSEYYRHKFRYIFVDEYQDTNHAQYQLVSLLTRQNKNLCVVGDDDQSIYRFRGATIENILGFEAEFPNCSVIRLEQNYRSTQTILDAANSVIANNEGRKEKHLWTELGTGDKIVWYQADDEADEAAYVVESIQKSVKNGGTYGENAILYRMNAQSNALERVLIRKDIPYRIYGGTRFYDRKEIRDMIAYMSIVENPSDIVRFGRIVNEPKRGIGDATVALIENITSDLHVSPLEVMQNVDDYPVLSKKAQALKKFAQMWTDLQNASLKMTLEEFLDYLLDKTGYRTAMQALGEEGELRLENIEELKSSMHTYEESAEEATLSGFLEEISLYTDVDKYEPDQDVVMLMTVHSAKGLEFSNVYLVGMEQGVFPGMRSMDAKDDVEEERRLAYVALTRAKKHLTISTTSSRMLFGMTMRNLPSQFLKEIDSSLIAVEKKQCPFGQKAVSRAPEPVQSMFLQRQMTAQKSAKSSPSGTIDLRVGDRIRHKTFGEGTILSMEKMGNDTMLEIGFDLVGTKKIMANFARSKFQKLS